MGLKKVKCRNLHNFAFERDGCRWLCNTHRGDCASILKANCTYMVQGWNARGEENMKIAKATIFATFQFHMGLYAKEKVRYRQCSWTNDYVMLLAEYLNMYSKCTQWKPFQNCSAKSELLCNFFPASGNDPQLGVLVNGSFLIHRTAGDMWESCPSLKYANFFNAI